MRCPGFTPDERYTFWSAHQFPAFHLQQSQGPRPNLQELRPAHQKVAQRTNARTASNRYQALP